MSCQGKNDIYGQNKFSNTIMRPKELQDVLFIKCNMKYWSVLMSLHKWVVNSFTKFLSIFYLYLCFTA